MIPVFGRFDGVPEFVTLEEAIASRSLVVTEMSEGGAVPLLKAHNIGAARCPDPRRRGARRRQAEPGAEHLRVHQAGAGDRHPGQLHRSRPLELPHQQLRRFRLSGRPGHPAGRERVGHGERQAERRLPLRPGPRVERGLAAAGAAQACRRPPRRRAMSTRSSTMPCGAARLSFTCLPGQTGLLALWSGRVAGLDVVASDKAYAKLHGRLVRSYALDAPIGTPSSVGHDRRAAEDWLAALGRVEMHASTSRRGTVSATGSPAGEWWARPWRSTARCCTRWPSPRNRDQSPIRAVIRASMSGGRTSPGKPSERGRESRRGLGRKGRARRQLVCGVFSQLGLARLGAASGAARRCNYGSDVLNFRPSLWQMSCVTCRPVITPEGRPPPGATHWPAR